MRLLLFVISILSLYGSCICSAQIPSGLSNRINAEKNLNIANNLVKQMEYNKAIALLEDVINTDGIGSMTKTNAYLLLSYALSDIGDYTNSILAYKNALRFAPDKSKVDQISIISSELFYQTGNFSDGINILNKITTDSLIFIRDLQLSRMYEGLGNYNKAITLLHNSINNNCPADIKTTALINLGYLYNETDSLEQAKNYLNSALYLLKKSEKAFEYYMTLGNHALVMSKLGSHYTAINEIRQVINYFPENSIDNRIAKRKLAEILLRAGKTKQAKNTFTEFFNSECLFLIENLPDFSDIQKLNLWLKEKPLLSKCFLLESYAPEFLYEVAMFRRQTSLLGIHDTENLQRRLATKPIDIRASLRDDEAAVEFISYSTLEGKQTYAALILPKFGKIKFVKIFDDDFIYQPETIGANSLINAIKRNDALGKNLLYSDTVLANKIWAPIINALPNKTSTIYFAPEGVFHFLAIENMPFDRKEQYHLHRVSSTSSLPYREISSRRSDKVLLIGGLNYSSMPEDSIVGHFSHEAAELLRQKAGNNNVFQYLSGTRDEVDSINALIDNTYLTHQIGEAKLKQEMPKFDIIHIATHGYSLNLGIRKRPEFAVDSLAYDISLNATGLALSGANIASRYADREDGILSAREICDLNLSNVDFVILSACQTAQGDITDEGAAGLVRGLKNAGVKTVLATLWSVDDKSTMLFMQEFYHLLYEGKTKHDAYIGAQKFLKEYTHSVINWGFSPKTLSKNREPRYITTKYDEPYYWAPFIIIDDL